MPDQNISQAIEIGRDMARDMRRGLGLTPGAVRDLLDSLLGEAEMLRIAMEPPRFSKAEIAKICCAATAADPSKIQRIKALREYLHDSGIRFAIDLRTAKDMVDAADAGQTPMIPALAWAMVAAGAQLVP